MTQTIIIQKYKNSTSIRIAATVVFSMSVLSGGSVFGTTIPFFDDFNTENGGGGSAIDYDNFANWDVTSGSVDVVINGHGGTLFGDGLFVDMVGLGTIGEITTKDEFPLTPGIEYRLKFDLSGNQRAAATDVVTVSVGGGSVFLEPFSLSASAPWETIVRTFTVLTPTNAKISFSGSGSVSNQGMLLDNVNLVPESETLVYLVFGICLLGIQRIGKPRDGMSQRPTE